MSYCMESFTRQDGLALFRMDTAGLAAVLAYSEMCVCCGKESLAAVKTEDIQETEQKLGELLFWKKQGYTRFLFDGYGLHSVASVLESLLSPWDLTMISVSDIRLAVLLPTVCADDAALVIWAYFSPVLEIL